ncbi:PIN domain-containing protein [Pedobacter aquae]|uniref:PIN domain-containing protein n=1 Tax=Pedobacter aquae TaxID=2605747 RepID=UPI00198149F7|nr:PIN domain-containing protein [Pedobacter aquae]
MSGDKLFIDSNILLYFLRGEKEIVEIISEKELVISFITELELLSFSSLSTSDEKNIKGLLKNCQIINLNEEIKDLTIELKRKYKLKLPDAIIAATAYLF